MQNKIGLFMPKPIKTVVFPVAGLGTRFLPATKAIPKEMLPILDKPLIHHSYEQARDAGIENFIFVTGRNKSPIENHFDHAYELQETLAQKGKNALLSATKDWLPEAGSIAFVRQMEPLGLGHAINCARNFVGDNAFAVILPDEMMISEKPFLKTMVEFYNENGGNVLGVTDCAPEDTHKYGILDIESSNGGIHKVRGMVEKPAPQDAPSNTSIIGPYILQPEIFDLLSKSGTGAGGEIQLTDSINKMAETTTTYGINFDGKRYDCGSRRGFLDANIACALSHDDMRDDVIKSLKNFIKEYEG
jgi:UTP--glucose-1-phosphate uridylyltransferase